MPHDRDAWGRALAALLPSVPEVDRAATRIWFHFFPLALAEAVAKADDPGQLAQSLRLDGEYRLGPQCNTSHWFLYGHRFWPGVKAAILARSEAAGPRAVHDLVAMIDDLACDVSSTAGVDRSLLFGIAAVGVMTLQQVGLARFSEDSEIVSTRQDSNQKSPERIAAARKTDDSQGLFGFLRGLRAQYSVTFDERRRDGRFTVINQQDLTSASATDARQYPGYRACREGPIPTQCRSASCGTCWVGILGGADKLSDVDPLEARRIQTFGYITSSEPKPIVRLACMARASGNVTIVIPSWNGFLGKAALGW